MSRTSTFPLANKALGGKLRARLLGARRRGASFEEISRSMHTDGVPVSGETVRRWCHEQGIESEVAAERQVAS